jgi:hypothetical protein
MLMQRQSFLRWPWLVGFLILCACAGAFGVVTNQRSTPSVRDELVGLQKRTGLSLVSVWSNRMRSVSFADRSVRDVSQIVKQGTAMYGAMSPDGTEIAFAYCLELTESHPRPNVTVTGCSGGAIPLAIIRVDGTGFRDFPNLRNASGPCWSYDNSKLALSATDRRQDAEMVEGLKVLNLESGEIRPVDGLDSFATSQCWSPDGKQLVYTMNKERGIQVVRLYDTDEKKSHDLADGGNATWSPDGKWIAYLHCPPDLRSCTYEAIRPLGNERKVLFRIDTASGGLYWSPDSRFVAYVSLRGVLEKSPGDWLQEDQSRVRVRRLEDNAEDWVLNLTEYDPQWFQWVTISEIAVRNRAAQSH